MHQSNPAVFLYYANLTFDMLKRGMKFLRRVARCFSGDVSVVLTITCDLRNIFSKKGGHPVKRFIGVNGSF